MSERFQITVESISGQATPAVIRLRGWLKVALRAFGLRVVTASQIDAAEAKPDALDGGRGLPI